MGVVSGPEPTQEKNSSRWVCQSPVRGPPDLNRASGVLVLKQDECPISGPFSRAPPGLKLPLLLALSLLQSVTSSDSLLVAGSTEQESTERSGMNFPFSQGFSRIVSGASALSPLGQTEGAPGLAGSLGS